MDQPNKVQASLDPYSLTLLGEELRSHYASTSHHMPPALMQLVQQLRNAPTDDSGPALRPLHPPPAFPLEAEGCFDPSSLKMLNLAFADSWPTLQQLGVLNVTPEQFARRLISLASQGEHEPFRMGAKALVSFIAEGPDKHHE